jgi:hypothetical protein
MFNALVTLDIVYSYLLTMLLHSLNYVLVYQPGDS